MDEVHENSKVFSNVESCIRDCSGYTLRFDQACLKVITEKEVTLWAKYDVCQHCVLHKISKFDFTTSLVVDTSSPMRYGFESSTGQLCNGTFQFAKFGQYTLNLTDVTKDECLPRMTAEPDATYPPILTAVVVLLLMATLWYVVKGIGKRLATGRRIASWFTRFVFTHNTVH